MRVLGIGDLHLSFAHPKYRAHCRKMRKKYDCKKVVFLGDIIENAAISYHDTDCEGFSSGMELEAAIDAIKPWYRDFPDADVTLGNHDKLVPRKMKTNNIPRKWLRTHSDVTQTPNWRWVEGVWIDGVYWFHGCKHGKSAALDTAMQMGHSVVVGHAHNHPGPQWFKRQGQVYFGLNVGCGIDKEAYPFAYAKKGLNEPPLGCGIVINGKQAYFEPMEA